MTTQIEFIVHHKVKTIGFSRPAWAVRIRHTKGVAWTTAGIDYATHPIEGHL
ncbi:MAG: hypothetical protein IT528_00770 [Nitrosomonas sp.]|nr:hypothetical protein [Nitrosomonas sp.]